MKIEFKEGCVKSSWGGGGGGIQNKIYNVDSHNGKKNYLKNQNKNKNKIIL
jgi:hypothetical protein